MRGDTVLGVIVHRARADLDLDGLAARPDDRRVQGAVAVLLGIGDVVVELAHDRLPAAVHDAERAVALLHVLDQYPHRAHVEQVTELDVLGAHLLPDAVDVLGAPEHLRLAEPGGPHPGA